MLKVLSLPSPPLFAAFVLDRDVIGLWPHVMLLNIAAHKHIAVFFGGGASREGCRVHDTQQSGMELPHRPPVLSNTCAAGLRDLNALLKGLKWDAARPVCVFILLFDDLRGALCCQQWLPAYGEFVFLKLSGSSDLGKPASSETSLLVFESHIF